MGAVSGRERALSSVTKHDPCFHYACVLTEAEIQSSYERRAYTLQIRWYYARQSRRLKCIIRTSAVACVSIYL